MKLDTILGLYDLIKGASIKEVKDSDDKYSLLKNFRILKKFNEEFNEFKDDAQKQVITNKEEFDEKIKKVDEDEEAKKYIDNLNKELQVIIIKELVSEKEIELNTISKESFIQFSDSGNFNLEQLDLLESHLVKN